MSDEPRTISAVLADLMANLPKPVSRELRVAEPVWRFMRDTYTKAINPDAATALWATPVVIDDDLTGGQWQLRENGETVASGDMAPAPDGMTVTYSPYSGWIAIRSDLMEPAASEWRVQ